MEVRQLDFRRDAIIHRQSRRARSKIRQFFQSRRVSLPNWVVLILFMLPAISTQIQWITFAPIAKDAAAFYTGGDAEAIDMLAVVFMLAYIPISFPRIMVHRPVRPEMGHRYQGVIILGLSGFMRILLITPGSSRFRSGAP